MFKFLNKKNNKSNQEVWIIAGLGNPGPEYEDTRHNCGFKTIDKLTKKIGENQKENVKFKSKYFICQYKDKKVVLLKPQTYMNNSGEAIESIMNWFKTDGMKSIIQHVGTENFTRIKVGIGPKNPNMDTVKFVLGHFSAEEKEKLDKSFEKAADAALLVVEKGVEETMNKFNSKAKKSC